MDKERREALLKEYGETCNSFRMLTEIRFKLLTIVPIATALGLGKDWGEGSSPLAISFVGMFATLGSYIYNMRNDQLYQELLGRAASIERSLDIPDGAFANRSSPWLSIRLLVKMKVDHGTGIQMIYRASLTVWAYGLLAPVLEAVRCAYVSNTRPSFIVPDPVTWTRVFAFAIAFVLTTLLIRSVHSQQRRRKLEAP